MRWIKPLTVLVLLYTLVFGISAWAQPQISGPQEGTLGPGTYVVVGDIQVRPNTTLTVAPGTTFLHNGHWYWHIYGTLSAVGTATDSIKFIRQQEIPDHRWGGIRFHTGALTGTMSYCVIDHALIASGTPSTYLGGGIFCDGVGLTLSHSRISFCDAYYGGAGIYVRNTNAFSANYCTITDNNCISGSGSNGGGIYLYNCGATTITHCLFARNSAAGT